MYPRTSSASNSTSSNRPNSPNRPQTGASECSSLPLARCLSHSLTLPLYLHRNVEECLILRDVFDKLGPGMRMDSPSYEELFEIVEAGSAQLAQWDKKWVDVMGECSCRRQRRVFVNPLPSCRNRDVRSLVSPRRLLSRLTFVTQQAMGRLPGAQDGRAASPWSHVLAPVHLPGHGRRRPSEDLPQDARVRSNGRRVGFGHPLLGCRESDLATALHGGAVPAVSCRRSRPARDIQADLRLSLHSHVK